MILNCPLIMVISFMISSLYFMWQSWKLCDETSTENDLIGKVFYGTRCHRDYMAAATIVCHMGDDFP
jgi:hypothetical protein